MVAFVPGFVEWIPYKALFVSLETDTWNNSTWNFRFYFVVTLINGTVPSLNPIETNEA